MHVFDHPTKLDLGIVQFDNHQKLLEFTFFGFLVPDSIVDHLVVNKANFFTWSKKTNQPNEDLKLCAHHFYPSSPDTIGLYKSLSQHGKGNYFFLDKTKSKKVRIETYSTIRLRDVIHLNKDITILKTIMKNSPNYNVRFVNIELNYKNSSALSTSSGGVMDTRLECISETFDFSHDFCLILDSPSVCRFKKKVPFHDNFVPSDSFVISFVD